MADGRQMQVHLLNLFYSEKYLLKTLQKEMDLEKTVISAVKTNSWAPNREQRLFVGAQEGRKTQSQEC